MKTLYKPIEPFVFGVLGIILTKEDAARVLRDNSYYFFVAGFILLFVFVAVGVVDAKINYSNNIILFFSIFYFVIGYAIRKFKSRVASLLVLISFSAVTLIRILNNDIGGTFVILLLFLVASIRSVKASFIYHKL